MLKWVIELSPLRKGWWTLHVDGASWVLGSGGEYETKDELMARYLSNVQTNLDRLSKWVVKRISRADNIQADTLAGIVATLLNEAILLSHHKKSINWMNEIEAYIRIGKLPKDSKQAHKIRVWATHFTLIGDNLCVCGNHIGRRTLAHRAHSQVLNPITSPWLFALWGMDIVSPPPVAVAKKKFLLITTDYFSKWVEVDVYASIKDKDVSKFIWKNIVCRFGIPLASVADNGPQFDSIAFRTFYSELKIKNLYSTPRYPQSNGQAETTNKTLFFALKKKLEEAKGKRTVGNILSNLFLPSIRSHPSSSSSFFSWSFSYSTSLHLRQVTFYPLKLGAELFIPTLSLGTTAWTTLNAIVRGQTLRKLKLKRSRSYYFHRLNSSILLYRLNAEKSGFRSSIRKARDDRSERGSLGISTQNRWVSEKKSSMLVERGSGAVK
ncbi:hypothetical protein AAG906_037136 [Vitis piasezkii]